MTKEGQTIREQDEEVGKKMFGDRIFESKSVKRAVSWGAAALTAVSLVPGSMGAETENSDNPRPNKKIEMKGETPSQKLLENVMGGGGGEPIQYMTLEPGYKGPEVAALKQRMFELGYFKSNTVNESFTDKTAEYVKKFEEINGLPVDGIADPEMQSLFFLDKARKADGLLVVPEKISLSPEELEEEKEVDQRFAEFLAAEGEYSDENLKKQLIHVEYHPELPVDLGYLESSDATFWIQAVLLFHKNKEGNDFFALGVKDKTGERKVTVVSLPIKKFFEVSSVVKIANSSGFYVAKFNNESECGSFFDNSINEMFKFMLLSRNVRKGDYLFRHKEFMDIYESAYLPNIPYSRDLLSDIYIPMKSKDLSLEGKKVIDSLKPSKILEVGNYQEFYDRIKTGDIIPVVFNINCK